MFHFPMNIFAPGLLPNPAEPAFAMNDLEGGEVIWMVFQIHKAAWGEKLKDICLGLIH